MVCSLFSTCTLLCSTRRVLPCLLFCRGVLPLSSTGFMDFKLFGPGPARRRKLAGVIGDDRVGVGKMNRLWGFPEGEPNRGWLCLGSFHFSFPAYRNSKEVFVSYPGFGFTLFVADFLVLLFIQSFFRLVHLPWCRTPWVPPVPPHVTHVSRRLGTTRCGSRRPWGCRTPSKPRPGGRSTRRGADPRGSALHRAAGSLGGGGGVGGKHPGHRVGEG